MEMLRRQFLTANATLMHGVIGLAPGCRPVAVPVMAPAHKPNVILMTSPDTPELSVLEGLSTTANTVAIGQDPKDFSQLTDDQWGSVDVLLCCGVGPYSGKKSTIEELWPKMTGLKWVHSASAGLEKVLFPAIVDSDVIVTNAKGIFSNSLAEWALTCCLWFAKDLPRFRAAQKDRRWEQVDVEELRGKTMGIIGYGDIGQATGRLAKAYQMNVIALRRRTERTEEEKKEGVLSALYGPSDMLSLIGESDYIVMATPYTPKTEKLFGREAVAAMKPTAVFINIGRGKCVDEPALTEALQVGKIRGAGLDVFYEEPLPTESPLYTLDNVLMTPHCADQTKEFQYDSLRFFVKNMERYAAGQDLLNIVDKRSGY